ncbi:hypothetical protein EV421DRAFT_1735975 [Armillaria borealis]|uniref:Uncharacterized protein n=1 Tax=Armillaria borealis TaxID=47425 RepID=A0AA39MR23_9AGAR|nr:hypothetical protein EV421DRAFT_1735975 [Armillaria borealis]
MSFNRHNEARSIERRHALGVIGWFSPGNDRRLIPYRATVSTSPSDGERTHDVVVGSFASCCEHSLKVTKLGHFGARRRRGASSQAKVVTDDEGQEVPRVLASRTAIDCVCGKSIIVSAATLLCFTFRSFYLMKNCLYLLDDPLVLQRRVRHLQYPRYPWNLGKTRRPLLSTDVLVSTLGIPMKRIEDEGTEV